MPKFSESPWVPMLLSTGIILSAFAGITYVLVNRLEPQTAHAHASHDESGKGHDESGKGHSESGKGHDEHVDSASVEPGSNDAVEEAISSDPENEHTVPPKTAHHPQWSYEGENGPAHWGQFAPLAQSGIRQSPIDLVVDRALNPANLAPVIFHYQDSIMALKNTGHTIQADCDPTNGIIIDGHHYTLWQFHFHARSEHLVDGRDYPMEVHLVHVISDQQNEDLPPTLAATKPAPNSLAVIGVMIKEGRTHELIKDLWTELPKAGDAPLRYKIKGLNASALLPPAGKRSFFRYNGSLTTPPCTENVLWTVMTEPIEFSKEQIDAFKKLYPRNNRPVQKTNQRFVLHYQDRTRAPEPSSQPTEPTTPPRPSLSPIPAPIASPSSLPPAQPVEPKVEETPLPSSPLRKTPESPQRPQPPSSQPAPPTPIKGTPLKPILSLKD